MTQGKISACIIVRDGAETLEKLLASVGSYADEIVVCIDSRTKDNTLEIALQYTKRVSYFDWIDDFSYARNLVANKAKYDNILVLDADDELEAGYEKSLKNGIDNFDAVKFIVKTSEKSFVPSIRCYNRKTAKYHFKVHEVLQFSVEKPQILNLGAVIHHVRAKNIIDPGRNIRILDSVIADYSRSLFYHARECNDNERYADAIISFQRYLEVSDVVTEKCEALLGMARAAVMLQDFKDAKKYCLEGIGLDLNFMPFYNMLGQIEMVYRNYKNAIWWFEISLNVLPTNYIFNDVKNIEFNTLGNLFVAYKNTGQLQKSSDVLEQCQKIDPENEWLKRQVKKWQKK